MPVNPKSLRNLRQYASQSAGGIGAPVDIRSGHLVPADDGSASIIQRLAANSTAEEILKAAEPAAASLLAKIVAGKVRVPAHVRANAALEILKRQGVIRPKQQPSADDSIARLREALRLREGREKAIDAVPAPAEPCSEPRG